MLVRYCYFFKLNLMRGKETIPCSRCHLSSLCHCEQIWGSSLINERQFRLMNKCCCSATSSLLVMVKSTLHVNGRQNVGHMKYQSISLVTDKLSKNLLRIRSSG
ncbi:hypothetical protein AVEN_247052-1 [Araneus ventricosus]|uniref:Uncharacterized protein n=1 Tax=Araneus ventricosus TaxID=182803 RepID=A0A4Y2SY18_ARAVE|nr:hypothetical protein AVEN_247052-1 [Araneus ventricosus]